MRVFGIAGYKDSGKTTLIVALIREFRRRGLQVATIKHAHHEFDIDHPGKDSHQHRSAGASEVIVCSARRVAHIRELEDEREPGLEQLLERLGPADLVLVEGYKHGDHPRLELRRPGRDAPDLAGHAAGVCAIVSDEPVPDAPVPVLGRGDVPAIADFIQNCPDPDRLA